MLKKSKDSILSEIFSNCCHCEAKRSNPKQSLRLPDPLSNRLLRMPAAWLAMT